MRRTRLKQKRETARRDDGRVVHHRLNPKGKTQDQRQYHGHIASLGCLVCGRSAEVHHILDDAPGKTTRRDHWFVAPLCPDHHRGTQGVHGLGRERHFMALYGIDLVAWATEAREHADETGNPFWQDSVTRCQNTALNRGDV